MIKEIETRYRAMVGEDWPAPLDELMNAVMRLDKHTPEPVVGRMLMNWSQDESISEATRGMLKHDGVALSLIITSTQYWGDTYLGPSGAWEEDGEQHTYPPKSDVTADAVHRWRVIGRAAGNAVLRARFAEAAWDLAHIAGEKRDIQDARAAVDAYLAMHTEGATDLHLRRGLRRAYNLSKSIKDIDRQRAVVERLKKLCQVDADDLRYRFQLELCDLLLSDMQSVPSPLVEEAIGWMDDGLAACASAGDQFRGEAYFKRLDAYCKQVQDLPRRESVARRFGKILEDASESVSGMLAMQLCKRAHDVYKSAGLRNEMKSARIRVETATKRSVTEMSKMSARTEVESDAIEQFVESIVGLPWPNCVYRFVGYNWHRRSDYETQLNSWLETAVIEQLVTTQVITVTGNSISLGSVESDRESHLIHRGAMMESIYSLYMTRVIDELVARHGMGPDSLMTIITSSPVFSDARHRVLQRCLDAYFCRDYVTFIHLGVTEAEAATRTLYRVLAGQSTITTSDGARWRTLTLSQILIDPTMIDFHSDLAFYLKVVLVHELGVNMRNLVCHGLIPASWFTRERSNRLLHVLLLIAAIASAEEQGESGEADAESPSTSDNPGNSASPEQ